MNFGWGILPKTDSIPSITYSYIVVDFPILGKKKRKKDWLLKLYYCYSYRPHIFGVRSIEYSQNLIHMDKMTKKGN